MSKLLLLLAILAVAWWMFRVPPRRIDGGRQAKLPPPNPERTRAARAAEGDPMAMVRVYDASAKQIVWMATSELTASMVEVQVDGIEGLVWVEQGARSEAERASARPAPSREASS
ncbi:hypothetical protein [Chondromyces crocatus]|uniref:Uncharacterized protein n=1 Tax=Chondromyces crocatus TaxID=52 RepID=A0A0K1ENC9_CHOCO|nr:hypothetical protein [Chondromyces crocatus]AKT42088.1 uncharacterized protein CMC5_063110 [Chondromyces crocatus]